MSCWHAVSLAGPARARRGMTGIALRRATPVDSEFCFQLHKAAMGGYVTRDLGVG